jgi:hypothetical protein
VWHTAQETGMFAQKKEEQQMPDQPKAALSTDEL